METDYTKAPRYPYLTSYLHNRHGIDSSVDPKYDWWFHHFPRRSEYWDLIHRHGKYYDRLDPVYLKTYSRFNNRDDYVPNWNNYRLSHPDLFGNFNSLDRTTRDPEKSEFEKWLENKYNILPRRERMDLLEKFYLDRYDQARYKNCIGGTYIPPSKLYDNPHYRNMSVSGNYST
jgi:murein DD-endopeptidase MepM/ murein hydrolase activator NlpD